MTEILYRGKDMTEKIATLLRGETSKEFGFVALFRCDPPYKACGHVVVTAPPENFLQNKSRIFPARATGEVLTLEPLDTRPEVSYVSLWGSLGYEVREIEGWDD